nr:MAG TPA: hypothetical protein [Caudoviricetes sp.]
MIRASPAGGVRSGAVAISQRLYHQNLFTGLGVILGLFCWRQT